MAHLKLIGVYFEHAAVVYIFSSCHSNNPSSITVKQVQIIYLFYKI